MRWPIFNSGRSASRTEDDWKRKVDATVLELAGRKRLVPSKPTPPQSLAAPTGGTRGRTRGFARRKDSPLPKPAGAPKDSPLPKPAGAPEEVLAHLTADRVLKAAFGGRLPRGVSRAAFSDCVEAKKREILAKAFLFDQDAWRNICEYLNPDNFEINATSPIFREFNRRRLPARGEGHVLPKLFFPSRLSASARFLPDGDLVCVDGKTNLEKAIDLSNLPEVDRDAVRSFISPLRGAELWNPGLGVQLKDLPEAFANSLNRTLWVECSHEAQLIALLTLGPVGRETTQVEIWSLLDDPDRPRRVLRTSRRAAKLPLKFSPDGHSLLEIRNFLSWGDGGKCGYEIFEWDVQTGQQRSMSHGLGTAFGTFLDKRTPAALVLGADDGRESGTKIVNIRSGKPLRSPPRLPGFLTERPLPTAAGEWLLFLHAQNSELMIGVTSLASGTAASVSTGQPGVGATENVKLVAAVSRDRTRLAIGCRSHIYIADMRSSPPQAQVHTVDGTIASIDWSPDDTHVATLSTGPDHRAPWQSYKVSIIRIGRRPDVPGKGANDGRR